MQLKYIYDNFLQVIDSWLENISQEQFNFIASIVLFFIPLILTIVFLPQILGGV